MMWAPSTPSCKLISEFPLSMRNLLHEVELHGANFVRRVTTLAPAWKSRRQRTSRIHRSSLSAVF